jgi:hypothetical protein
MTRRPSWSGREMRCPMGEGGETPGGVAAALTDG